MKLFESINLLDSLNGEKDFKTLLKILTALRVEGFNEYVNHDRIGFEVENGERIEAIVVTFERFHEIVTKENSRMHDLQKSMFNYMMNVYTTYKARGNEPELLTYAPLGSIKEIDFESNVGLNKLNNINTLISKSLGLKRAFSK